MEIFLPQAGVKLNYEEAGENNYGTVIIMHGWGCNLETVKIIAASIPKGYRIINLDLPGHGKSEEPKSVWGVENFASCLREFVEILKIESPSLIGHSFGGRISILYSSLYPTDKVVLVDSAGIKPKRKANYYYKVYSYKFIKKIFGILYKGMIYEKKIEKLRNKHGSADYKNSTPMMKDIMSRCVNEDLKKYMPSIKSPVLLIWGEKDTATPISDARIMNKLIPDSGLVSFPNCGHYSFLDNPYRFKLVIREFLKKE